jgi:hypothetical protein
MFNVKDLSRASRRLEALADERGNVPEPGDRPDAFSYGADRRPADWDAFVKRAAAETERALEAHRDAVVPRLTPQVSNAAAGRPTVVLEDFFHACFVDRHRTCTRRREERLGTIPGTGDRLELMTVRMCRCHCHERDPGTGRR